MRLIATISFLFLFSFVGNAQEYWDREDFEINRNGIENSWKDLGFSWINSSNFSLPEVNFLEKDVHAPQTVDMVATINRMNAGKPEYELDLAYPLPRSEKKTFEVTGGLRAYDADDYRNNPIMSNPFYQMYDSPYRSLYRNSRSAYFQANRY